MALTLLAGCTREPASDGSESGNNETGESTSGAVVMTTGVDSTGAPSPDSTGGPWEAPLARGGITVDWVQANQGVGVPIGADGAEVGPADRVARLLRNRITLIRAFWVIPDDWEPREIEGRLIITNGDGTEEILTDSKVIDDESFEGDLGRSFFWGLMADQTQPGLKYRVELHETSPDYDDLPEGDTPPTLPVDDSTAFVGIETSYQVMKVVLVPFNYDDGANCTSSPDTSDETMQLFQDLIYMQNPLERLEFEVHAPVDWDTPLDSFVPLNNYMAGLRFDEGAPPETYYYGLINVCSGGLGGAGGLANGIPMNPVSEAAAVQRVSSGLSLDPDWSAETFVHEVGHSQGRRHVACNGEEGGPNPQYPHEGGDVGEWGFGVIDYGLRHPTFYKDYMTYCHPTWVGTWGWNKVYPVIAGLSEWDDMFPGADEAPPEGPSAEADPDAGPAAAAPADRYGGSLLMGSVEPNGQTYWITVPGELPAVAERGPLHIELRAGDELVADVPAHVQSMQDGDGGTLILAPLPRKWSSVTGVTVVDGPSRTAVPRGSIDEHHQNRNIRR
ncbi:MAG: hypothetical protein AAGF11_13445 [Myxococcota bacterium]